MVARPKAFAPGDTIDGRYELRGDIGRGGGGIVFEACHLFTGRRVALKILGAEVSRAQLPEFRARLVREARALATARHPGIVDVLDGGVTEDGTPYFAMEKLEGRTLEGLLAARRTISLEDAAAVGLQICDAMARAHAVGVVHRDLKPSNIFIVRDTEGFERVKVVDFGAAQIAGADEKLTTAGALMGTPAYMAPEQLLAQDDVDLRVDVYALGITLIECLTGQVPYEGSYQKVLLQVCRPKSALSLRGQFPELSEAITTVIERAIATEPDARFQTMRELARAIHAAVPSEHRRLTVLGPPPLPTHAGPGVANADSRRRMPRAPYITPVSVLLKGGAIDGRTEDISEGGLLVITRQPCLPGQIATVRFAAPMDGKVVSCEAHVRWVRAARSDAADGTRAIGLEFVDAPPEIRSSIGRYVAAMGGETREGASKP